MKELSLKLVVLHAMTSVLHAITSGQRCIKLINLDVSSMKRTEQWDEFCVQRKINSVQTSVCQLHEENGAV